MSENNNIGLLKRLSELSDIERIILDEFREQIFDKVSKKKDREWLDDLCLLRYLRARKWDREKAEAMLLETLEWRKEYKPLKINESEIKHILDLQTMYRNGKDKLGRPILYVKTTYNPASVEDRIKCLIFTLEEAIKSMDSFNTGVDKMCWIIDFNIRKAEKKSPDGGKVAKKTIYLLQNHYPERLGNAIVLNAPWYMRMFWKVISVFMEVETREKFIFLTGNEDHIKEKLLERIDEDQLESCYGGNRQIGPERIWIKEIDNEK